MDFSVTWDEGVPHVVFDGEPQPRSWLLAFFLEEARLWMPDFLAEIDKARRGVDEPAGFTGNSVDITFYPDRAVIESLYPVGGPDADPETTEITLDEAEQLLLKWKEVLAARQSQTS